VEALTLRRRLAAAPRPCGAGEACPRWRPLAYAGAGWRPARRWWSLHRPRLAPAGTGEEGGGGNRQGRSGGSRQRRKAAREKNKGTVFFHKQWQVGNFKQKLPLTRKRSRGRAAMKIELQKNYFWLWLLGTTNPFGWLLAGGGGQSHGQKPNQTDSKWY
jgi:hypothetical protein